MSHEFEDVFERILRNRRRKAKAKADTPDVKLPPETPPWNPTGDPHRLFVKDPNKPPYYRYGTRRGHRRNDLKLKKREL